MFNNSTDFKYETLYNISLETTKCCTNDTITLQYDAIKLGIVNFTLNQIHLIQKLKILSLKIDVTISHSDIPVIYFCLYVYCFRAWNKIYHQICTGILLYIHIVFAPKFFTMMLFFPYELHFM